jgi:K+-sensing histidine kinase KdpD
VTALVSLFHLYPTIPNISIVYLLVILALAHTRGRFAAVVAAVVAFLAFDFFLVPPFYTFYIARWEEWLALGVFLVTALLTSQWTAVMRKSIEDARRREREAQILYEVGRVINIAEQLEDQLDSIALAFVRVFSSWGVRECALLLPDPQGTLTILADAPIRIERFTLSPDEMAAAQTVMDQGKMIERRETASASTSSSVFERQALILRLIPLKTGNQVLGVLCLRIEEKSWFASEQRMGEAQGWPTDRAIFFWTFLDEAILVIERAQLRSQARSHPGERPTD